jgi:signal transduction histidine kinase
VLQAAIDDLHFPEELPEIQRRFAEHAAGTRTREEELAFRRRDGAAFYADLSSNLITYDNRSCVIAFLRDVTDRRAERAAREKQRQTLRYLLQASEHDRRLLAYEIHDGVAQPLVAAVMQLQASQRLLGKSPEQSEQALADGVQALRQAYAETRRLTAAVRSPILDQGGLEVALADLVQEAAKRSRRKIQFQSQVRFGRLPTVLENALYRIAQEAVNNACRHSKSKTIAVQLIQDGSAVCLEVRDWGKGFDPASVPPGAMGLEGIRERVRLLDGSVVIDSQPRHGTTLRVTLPLPETAVK